MERIEARPTTPATKTPPPAPTEVELRRELGDAIANREAADARARAAKHAFDKAEALMCATGEKVAYGGHRSRLIPIVISYDAFAQAFAAMDAMRSGAAIRVFQASQQASTISS